MSSRNRTRPRGSVGFRTLRMGESSSQPHSFVPMLRAWEGGKIAYDRGRGTDGTLKCLSFEKEVALFANEERVLGLIIDSGKVAFSTKEDGR